MPLRRGRDAPAEPELYVILGSHACRTGMLLLEHKGIGYRTVEVPVLAHPLAVRLLGFPGGAPARGLDEERRTGPLAVGDRLGTVPALRIGRERVQTNHEIARFLDRLQPDPPLFPADPDRRRAVEEAEAWGNDVFQMVARRNILITARRGLEALHCRGNEGRLGTLLWRHESIRIAGTRFLARFAFGATGEAVPRLRAELPEHLEKIDEWIGAGVLNSESLNAADLMIASSLALLSYCNDLRPEIESRPALALLDRVLPEPPTC